MIKIKTIRFSNHFSFGNDVHEIQLDRAKTTLVIGKNGAGKSSAILDTLCYGLYGKPYRKIKLGQLVNSITGRDHLVEVDLEAGGHAYRVRRGVKPGVFEIFRDGHLVPQPATTREYQEWLEQSVLKMNYKTFVQIVILGTAKGNVHFLQLPAAQRREVVEDIHDIQVYSTMTQVLKEKAAGIKESLAEIEKRLAVAQRELEVEERHQASVSADIDSLLDQKGHQLEAYTRESQELTDQIEALSTRAKELTALIADADEVDKRIRTLVSLQDKIDTNAVTVGDEIRFYRHSDSCPTCKQDIDDEFKSRVVQEKETRYQEFMEGLKKLGCELEASRKRMEYIRSVHDDISSLDREAITLRQRVRSNREFEDSLRGEIRELTTRRNADREARLVQELRGAVAEIGTERDHVIAEARRIGQAASIVKQMPAKIIAQFMPVMNRLVNKYLSEMELFCDFYLDEEFNETIRSRHRDTFSYDSFSEGEKLRIDLAILFAWRDIARMRSSAAVNLLVFDEILDSSLDVDGSEYLLGIVQKLADGVHCFIVSHKGDSLVDKFDDVVTFSKVSNFSRVDRNG